MTVSSPSSTTTWKRCPVKWALTQQRIVERQIGKRDLAAVLGSSYAQAMHVYRRARQAGVEPGEAPWDAAQGYLLAQQHAWAEAGRVINPYDQAQAASLERRLASLVTYAITHDPLPADWVPVMIEESLGPEAGNARPDLVCRKPDGAYVVLDDKSTLTLGARPDERKRKLQMRLDEWRDSDQLYHGAWFVGQRYQTVVTHVAIILAEVEPKPQVTIYDFWLDPDRVTAWAAQQRQAWLVMAEHQRDPALQWRAATHADNFGRCEYYDWCYGSPLVRETDYTTQPRS